MTDIMKLADDYATQTANAREGWPICYRKEARAALQSAIEALQGENKSLKEWQELARVDFANDDKKLKALQAENERLKTDGACWKQLHDEMVVERDALQAKLDELQRQEPVAYSVGNTLKWHEGKGMTNVQLFAAPKAPTHGQVEEAWRAGWAACRDAEYVGQEAEDEAWGMSETCANADWENAAPKALEPLTVEEIERIHQRYGGDMVNCTRAIERHHGITKGTPT